jgi:hypothetical protein
VAQLAEKLFQVGKRYLLALGDVGQGDRFALGMGRDIDHGHHGVSSLGTEFHAKFLLTDRPLSPAGARKNRYPA